MFDREIFRKRIKELTDRKNTTQKAVADDCGFSESKLSKMLNGEQDISAQDFFLLADYFNVPADSLRKSGDSRKEQLELDCRDFCTIIAKLAVNGQLVFTEVKDYEEMCCEIDPEDNRWFTKKVKSNYFAFMLPNYEDMPYIEPGDENFIRQNFSINVFIKGIAQIASLYHQGLLDHDIYEGMEYYLIQQLPEYMPMLYKRNQCRILDDNE